MLYEDAPQELRSRLWMALLADPSLTGFLQHERARPPPAPQLPAARAGAPPPGPPGYLQHERARTSPPPGTGECRAQDAAGAGACAKRAELCLAKLRSFSFTYSKLQLDLRCHLVLHCLCIWYFTLHCELAVSEDSEC